MKRAFVILIGLSVAAAAGVAVYRAIDHSQPTVIGQGMGRSSAFSSSMTSSPPIAATEQDSAAAPEEIDSSRAMSAHAPEYTDYEDGVIGNGKKVVLFFRSPEDGSTVQSDRELIALYSAGAAAVSTYRVEYEKSGMLRRTYKVRMPNTFVLLDENGTIMQSATDPAPEILEALVR